MEKSRRKFRTALFGVIAAVVAAAGGGWAVHFALSVQNNLTSATNGSVAIRDIQGSSVTYAGSGDISQGTQYKTQGDIYQIEGSVPIGITLGQYKAGLKRREREVTKELKQAQAEERRILEIEKSEIERRLADTQASYQAYIEELKERIAQLETIRGQVSDTLLDQAREALARGDRSEADRLFAQFEDQSARVAAESTRAAAAAAYQRSRIALDEIRYRDAYAHARRAARLAPDNGIYLAGAGELAQILGDYTTAKDYLEQALAIALKTYGEDHPDVAAFRNNLGEAWRALGKYQKKAIVYYEQALAGDLKTYGEDHPAVATVHNNLGLVWQALGEYQKAIGYFEQALASDLRIYGEDHPAVARDRNSLGSVWQALGEHQKAIGYFEQALASDLKTYGEDHPDVALSRNNLGAACYNLGEYQRAIGYLEQALASDIQTYGEDHPDVAIRRNNLGAVWQALGEYPKAIGYFEQALPVLERKLGPEHPSTERTRARLTAARAGQDVTDAAGREQDPWGLWVGHFFTAQCVRACS